MRLLGLDIRVTKAAVPAVDLSAFDGRLHNRGWVTIHEPFSGAWQHNVPPETPANMMGFAAVYSCVSRIAEDIAKLRMKLNRLTNGIWVETVSPAFSPVLRKPNRYQTWMQFISQWICSKRLTGNTYVWKEYDNRQVVSALYVLDPSRVEVKVAVDGSVWYTLRRDYLSGLSGEETVVPADEIIHDRCITPWHPLVGVSPLFAHAMSATQGMRIQTQSAAFFENASRPGGVLSPKAPSSIPDGQLERVKSRVEEGTTGRNVGRLLVFSNEMLYQTMAIPAADAQLAEQFKLTVEDVGRAHRMPLYKLGIGEPRLSSISQLQHEYYSECLQADMESIEALLADGLALPSDMEAEFDLEGLTRLDQNGLMTWCAEGVKGSVLSPNEARGRFNLPPVDGGDQPLSQQQYFSLEQLSSRGAAPEPAAATNQSSVAPPSPATANSEPAPAEPTPNKALSAEPEYTELELVGMAATVDQVIERARSGGAIA